MLLLAIKIFNGLPLMDWAVASSKFPSTPRRGKAAWGRRKVEKGKSQRLYLCMYAPKSRQSV